MSSDSPVFSHKKTYRVSNCQILDASTTMINRNNDDVTTCENPENFFFLYFNIVTLIFISR